MSGCCQAITLDVLNLSKGLHSGWLQSYQGHVSVALVLGGVNVTGPHLHTIYPHGSTDSLPFATMGSGSLVTMAVFNIRYNEGLTLRQVDVFNIAGGTQALLNINSIAL